MSPRKRRVTVEISEELYQHILKHKRRGDTITRAAVRTVYAALMDQPAPKGRRVRIRRKA